MLPCICMRSWGFIWLGWNRSGFRFKILRVYLPLCVTDGLRRRCLAFYVFTNLSTIPTTSGGSIFRCTTKDGGERRAKGLKSRPLESGFLYGGLEGRRAYLATCSPGCNLRDLGPSGGVPSAFVSCGYAETRRFLHAKTLTLLASTASAGLSCTAPTAAKTLALKE